MDTSTDLDFSKATDSFVNASNQMSTTLIRMGSVLEGSLLKSANSFSDSLGMLRVVLKSVEDGFISVSNCLMQFTAAFGMDQRTKGWRDFLDAFTKSVISFQDFVRDAKLTNPGQPPAPVGQIPVDNKESLSFQLKKMAGSFGTMVPHMIAFGLLMKPVSALLEGILAPLDMLLPILEIWGVILGQLLMPIIMAIVPILMELTPLFMTIVSNILPLLDWLVPLLGALVPILDVVITFINCIISAIGVVFNFIGIWLETAWTQIANDITEALSGVIGAMDDFVTEIEKIVDNIRNFFTSPTNPFGIHYTGADQEWDNGNIRDDS